MKVALYCRCSTSEQSPEMQLRELREYATRRGWTIAGEYIDSGISGTKDSRPELNRLMDDAHKRLFDCVAVWKFDRFARSVSHLLRALETFKSLGVEFVSYSEAIDTASPVGKMTLTVLGAVAELERSLIVERTKAGQRNAKLNGKHVGRPRATVNDAEIQNLLTAGNSMAEVGALLGVSASTICRRAQGDHW
jgi:DNA invertase Pin-like site-specific DNA recombinase